jgi:glycosyltransferase involved in cell wall biosynthesis
MISLMDTWVMNPEEYPRQLRWVPWYPVDHDPMPQIVRGKVSQAYKRITFSKHGVEKTHEAGLDCYYIPHGIETDIFKPKDKAEAREHMGLPNDKFVVGTVAMNKGNPSRKCFVEMMDAFARFHARHPESIYVLQTDRGEGIDGMINLPELVRNMGLIDGQDVVFCNQYQNMVGFPPEYMAEFYNALDVHLITTRGEGFGIPVLESQACGTPVITGGWTACKELFFAGQMLDPEKDAEREYSGLASWQFRPRVGAIEAALEAEYQRPSDGSIGVERAQEYNADLVTEKYWKPILAEIEVGLVI